MAITNKRIARSLVTVIFLTLFNVIAGPILNYQLPSARAADSALVQSNLLFSAYGSELGANGISLIGSPTYTAGPPPYYTFDSDSKYGYTNIDFGTNAQVSIFMWVYPTAAGIVLNHNGTTAQDSGWRTSMIDYTGSKFRFGLYDGVTGTVSVEANVSTPVNNWYFIGFTYSGGSDRKLTSYINGVATGSVVVTNGWSVPGTTPGSNYFHIGSKSTNGPVVGTGTPSEATVIRGGGRFRLSELIFYSASQSSADVLANFNATQSRYAPSATNPSNVSTLVNRSATYSTTCTGVLSSNGSTSCAYQWQLSTDNGASWSPITGATSSSYTTPNLTSVVTGYQYRVKVYDPGSGSPATTFLATISGAAKLTVVQPPGSDTDTALSFNGSTTYAEVSDSTGSPYDITGDFSFEAWVNPATTCSGSGAVFSKNLSYMMYCQAGKWMYMLLANGSGTGAATSVPVEANEWHHIAYTKSASSGSMLVYYDGLLVQTIATGVTSMIPNDGVFRIGQYTGSYVFNGQIDELRIYNSQRTQAQIQSDMHAYGDGSDTGLAVYYDFNEGSGSTLYNRKFGSTSATDVTLYASPTWSDVKSVDTSTLSAYTILKFTRTYITANGGWKVPAAITRITALVVAGGGGGGSRHGGGGGAGGLAYAPAFTVNPEANYQVVVGRGGRGYGQLGNGDYTGASGASTGTNSNGAGLNGNNSLFGRIGVSESITAIGGGGGSASNVGGGSSGGTNTGSSFSTVGPITQYSTSYFTGFGNLGGQGYNGTSCGTDYCGGGGGGAGGVGGVPVLTSDSSTAGVGGAGKLYSISGVDTYYAGGGGGASKDATNVASGGSSIGGAGGKASQGLDAVENTGSGGGGGGFNLATSYRGGNGAFGIVIIRYITSLKPTFTNPTTAYLNAGMTETFTTNVAQDSATAVLTRTFRWESSTTGVNGTYSLIKQGTGAANAAFSWVPQDTQTSGSTYAYRVVVTDSDTAGLFIVDTSTPVWAIINQALKVSGTSSISKRINLSRNETFTITLGTSTYRPSLAPVIPGITLDTSTAGIAVIKIADTVTVGTCYETLTVIDSVSASVVTPLIIKVAAPPTLLNSSEVISDNLVFSLEAGNSASLIADSGTVTTGITWNDLSGGKANASTGAGVNTGGLSGTTCSAPTYTAANGGALNFSANTTTCYYASEFTGKSLINNYTVEAWFKTSATLPSGAGLLGQATPNTSAPVSVYIVNYLTSGLIVSFYDNVAGVERYANCPYVPTIGAWTHISGTYDGTTLTTYINGSSRCTATSSWTPNSTTNSLGFIIGNGPSGGTSTAFPGSIASVRMYNKSLTSAQILANYNATKARFDNSNNTFVTPAKKYGTTLLDSFTATSGLDTKTVTFSVGDRAGIDWDTTTVTNRVNLTLQESMTVSTFYDTVTVTDALGQSTYLPITMTTTKADSLTVTMSSATTVVYNGSQLTVYPRPTITGLKWTDTATSVSRFSSALYSESTVVPTNADTYTVRGTVPTFTLGSIDNYLGVIYDTSTAVINKARQNPLGVFMYGGVVGSPYLIWLQGGNGTGGVTESLTGVSTLSGCAVNNHYLTAVEQKQGFCEVRVVKAGDQNYYSETQTVQMYFMAYLNNQPTGVIGSGSTIGLNGKTSLTIDDSSTVRTPRISGFSKSGSMLTINGEGFGNSPVTITFERYVNAATNPTPTLGGTVIVVAIPGTAVSGPVLVITSGGRDSIDWLDLP